MKSEIRNPQSEILRVLLIEDDPEVSSLVRKILAEVRYVTFELESAQRLSGGLARLAEGGI